MKHVLLYTFLSLIVTLVLIIAFIWIVGGSTDTQLVLSVQLVIAIQLSFVIALLLYRNQKK